MTGDAKVGQGAPCGKADFGRRGHLDREGPFGFPAMKRPVQFFRHLAVDILYRQETLATESVSSFSDIDAL